MAAPANGAVAHQPAEVAAPAATISRQTLQLVDIGPGQASGFALPEGKKMVLIEDRKGLAKDLHKVLKARGVDATVQKADSSLPADLGSLVIVANGGKSEKTRAFLLQAFQRTREAAPILRACKGSVFTITSMDGAFGLKGKDFDPFVGALAGIPKTIAHEWPEVFCRAIDRAAKVSVETVLEELMKDGPVEVALSKDRRETLTTVPVETTPGPAYLGPDDVVLVTGGARGVTAACAIAVARQYKSRFVLLGRTPLEGSEFNLYPGVEDEGALKRAILESEFKGKASPKQLQEVSRKVLSQREIQGTLAQLKEAGVEALYLSCDVRDKKALKSTLAEVKKSLGQVTSLIHGAGVLADRKIEDKTDEQFEAVFSTKIDSLVHLTELLPSLASMVFFSSVTARFGRPGQIDYCMANEVLNKFAQLESRRRPRCKVVAMGWGPWEGGMVTPALAREFKRIGVGLIPLAAGAQAVVDEFSHHGAIQAEVLFGDGFPEPQSPQGRKQSADDHPGELLLEKTLSVESLPFLKSHQIGGKPVLPMAFMQEWFVQGALQSGAGLRLVGVEDLRVFRGATIEDGVEPTLAVGVKSTQPRDDGQSSWVLELRDIGRNILHARATVILGDAQPGGPAPRQLNGLASTAYSHSPAEIYSQLLFHGTDFHAVEQVKGISDEGLLANLKVASKPSNWEKDPLRSDWATEPLVVDGVLQLGILWCWHRLGKPSLPNGFASYRQFVRRFPRKSVQAALRVVSFNERSLVADCEILDQSGQLVAVFEKLEWTAAETLKSAFGLEQAGALA